MKMSIKFDGNEVILSSIDSTSDTLIFTASKDVFYSFFSDGCYECKSNSNK